MVVTEPRHSLWGSERLRPQRGALSLINMRVRTRVPRSYYEVTYFLIVFPQLTQFHS